MPVKHLGIVSYWCLKDTYVFYQSILEKKTYESQIWSVCIAKRRNVVTLWCQTPVVSMTTRLINVLI